MGSNPTDTATKNPRGADAPGVRCFVGRARGLGQQTHPEVSAAVLRVFAAVRETGKPVGINAFDPALARSYAEAGAAFILVGADVVMLARGSEAFAAAWGAGADGSPQSSY